MTRASCWLVLGVACAGLANTMGGCNVTVTAPPESVLFGTWKLVPTSGDTNTMQMLVFDAAGKLTELRTIAGTGAGSTTVTQTNVHQSTSVSGSVVRIVTVNNTVFDGTFNEERTVATGTVSTVVTLGDTTINTTLGTATLTRQ